MRPTIPIDDVQSDFHPITPNPINPARHRRAF
jgi:hypothetical protein